MKRPIVSLLFAFAALFLGCGASQAAETEIKLDDTGKWNVPLRYWFHQTLFGDVDAFAFLAEVTALGPAPEAPAPDNLTPRRFRKGELQVIELLSRGESVPARLADVRTLDVEGADGLQVGDRLIVLVCREPYENGYVINYHDDNCILGIPLSPTTKAKLENEEEAVLLEYFRGGKSDVAKLSEDQMTVWRKLDPKGIASALAMHSEMKAHGGE